MRGIEQPSLPPCGASGVTLARLLVGMLAGVLYCIAVDGFEGAEGNVTLMFTNLAGLPPLLAARHGAPGAAEPLWSTVAGHARLD